jgi:hypothetical protein
MIQTDQVPQTDVQTAVRYVALGIAAKRHFEGMSASALRSLLPDDVVARFGRRWFVDEVLFTSWLASRRQSSAQSSLRRDFVARAASPGRSLRPGFGRPARGSSAASPGGSHAP